MGMRHHINKVERLLQQHVQSQEVSNGTHAEATGTGQSISEQDDGVHKDIQECQDSFKEQHENLENVITSRTGLDSTAHNMSSRSSAPTPRNPILAIIAGARSPLEEAKTTRVAEAHHLPKA